MSQPRRASASGAGEATTPQMAVVLSVLFAGTLAPLWLRRVLPRWDATDLIYPFLTYVADALREGRFPMWDPYTGAGEPFHAEPNRMVLNPLVLLLGRLVPDTYLVFLLVWLLHWWFGAMGMLWLSRRFGASPLGALASAGAFAFCGFFVSNAEHTPWILVAGWLPWILGLADAAVARRSAPSALLAAAAIGTCAVSGGYPMLVAFTGIAVAAWLALRFLAFDPADGTSRRTRALWVVGTLGVMAAVLLAAWAPLLHAFVTEGAAVSARLTSTSAHTAIWGDPFTLRAASSLLFPFATIHAATSGLDMSADISMTNAYMGFAAVPLAATWAWLGLRERRSQWLLVFVALMLLVSLGGVGGLRIVLHYLVPPLRHMRFNAGFRLFWIVPTCLAAGLGLTLVVEREGARRTFLRFAVAWSLAAAAAAALVVVWLRGAPVPLEQALPSLLLPAALALPAVLVAAALALRHPRAGGALLAGIACLDAAAGLYVNQFTVWSPDASILPLVEEAHVRVTAVGGSPRRRLPASVTGPFNSHLILKLPVLRTYTTLRHEDLYERLYGTRFEEVLSGPARFWLAPAGETLPDRANALAELGRSGARDPVPVFVEEQVPPAARVAPGTYGRAEVEYFRPEEVALGVNVPPSGGILASVERWTPGWKVLVDGRPATALRTNVFFRGVRLEPGAHRVVWRYEPEAWWPLVGVSAVTLTGAVAVAVLLAIRARRRHRLGAGA